MIGLYRGIGLAVTEILLEDFNAIALCRTTSHELRALYDDRFNLSAISIDPDAQSALPIIECDVTDEGGLSQAIIETNKKHGRIDG